MGEINTHVVIIKFNSVVPETEKMIGALLPRLGCLEGSFFSLPALPSFRLATVLSMSALCLSAQSYKAVSYCKGLNI